MLTIGIADSGMGGVAVLEKLYDCLPADYICYADTANHPYGGKTTAQLKRIAENAVSELHRMGADAVVIACNTLSLAMQPKNDPNVFCCEPPVAHASAYTASKVLAVGTAFTAEAIERRKMPNVISLALPELATMVENNVSKNEMVKYIEALTAPYDGSFDCIALGCTHYSLCRDCFSRVYPNVKIFDSVDGIARRVKKSFAKQAGESSVKMVFTSDNENNAEKYSKILKKFCQPY